ncbi:MAG: hypothetical protein ACKVWV_12690 [Planctomycetota bacterium]
MKRGAVAAALAIFASNAIVPVRAFPPANDVDVAQQLRALGAASAAERAAAARWLSGHLSSVDLATLRDALIAGDAEAGRWITYALGERDTHLGLAVALARDADARLQDIGREVIAELALRWSPGRDRAPKRGKDLLEDLENVGAMPIALSASGTVATLVDRIARVAWDGPRLVVDPRIADASSAVRAPEHKGAPLEVVLTIADAQDAELVGFGAIDGEDVPVRWLCVTPKSAATESGSARLSAWLLDAADVARPERRAPAAIALAESGWPAALGWLEERAAGDRATGERDEIAFDALCVAAARGQIARAFSHPDVRRELLERMRRELARESAAGDARAEAIARALGAAGPLGPGGEDLALQLLEGTTSLPLRERWLRLVAVEGARTSSVAARRAVAAILVETARPAPLAFQALRACASMEPAPDGPKLAVLPFTGDAGQMLRSDARNLIEWCRERGSVEELVRAVRAIGATGVRFEPAPREAFGEPTALEETSRILDVCEWALAVRDDAYAAECVRALTQRGEVGAIEDAAARCAAYVRAGFGARIAAVIEAARAGATLPNSVAMLDALAVLSGCASDEAEARALARASDGGPYPRLDLACLGALTASKRGVEARHALVGWLPASRGADPKDLLAALTRATDALLAARAETELREFVATVRSGARGTAPAVRAGLRVDQWPAARKRAVRRLDTLDRRLAELSDG